MIRIYKFNSCDEIIFEDFYKTNMSGKTENIPLLVSCCDDLSIIHQTCETYYIDIHLNHYESLNRLKVNIFGNQSRILKIYMVKEELFNFDVDQIKIDNDLLCENPFDHMLTIQKRLNFIASFYQVIPMVHENGILSDKTKQAIFAFQHLLGVNEEGEINHQTWKLINKIYDELLPLPSSVHK